MKVLWQNVDNVKFADWILIQCYMGWRPQELSYLTVGRGQFRKRYMQAGMKTEAGEATDSSYSSKNPKNSLNVIINLQFLSIVNIFLMIKDRHISWFLVCNVRQIR